VIFDCDGVLVDSEPVVTGLMARYFSAHGLPLEPAEVHDLFVGGTLRGAGAEAAQRGAVLPDDWFEVFTAQMFDLLRQGVPLISGVVELLDALDAAGVATAIVSNGSMDKMQITLAPWGLLDRFEGRIFSGYEHGAPKPAPHMVLAAMQQAGVDAKGTVMIDDSPAGCRAGVAAGVRTFGFATEGQDGALADVGAEVVGTMAQIQRLIAVPRAKSLTRI
jgi:HAD superfamily hydrolase (TIGR01509 family)